jgi:hypothetical protein
MNDAADGCSSLAASSHEEDIVVVDDDVGHTADQA